MTFSLAKTAVLDCLPARLGAIVPPGIGNLSPIMGLPNNAIARSEFILAGHDTLNVARATHDGISSLVDLRQAPRCGMEPGNIALFSPSQKKKAMSFYEQRANEEGIDQELANRLCKKLLGSFHCVDPITFRQALIQMGLAVAHFVGNEPYYLFTSKKYRSHWFIYQNLLNLGLIPAADAIHTIIGGENNTEEVFSLLNAKRNYRGVILDDCAFTGRALLSWNMLKDCGFLPENCFVGMIGCTDEAWNRVFQTSASYYVGLRINALKQAFTQEEIEIHHRIIGKLSTGSSMLDYDFPDTFTYYKVPDNITFLFEKMGLFTEPRKVDSSGRIVLPSRDPFYFEMMHPELTKSYSHLQPNLVPTIRDYYERFLGNHKFGPQAVLALADELNKLQDVSSNIVDIESENLNSDEPMFVFYLDYESVIVFQFYPSGEFVKSMDIPISGEFESSEQTSSWRTV